jgi:hypothetical protein
VTTPGAAAANQAGAPYAAEAAQARGEAGCRGWRHPQQGWRHLLPLQAQQIYNHDQPVSYCTPSSHSGFLSRARACTQPHPRPRIGAPTLQPLNLVVPQAPPQAVQAHSVQAGRVDAKHVHVAGVHAGPQPVQQAAAGAEGGKGGVRRWCRMPA